MSTLELEHLKHSSASGNNITLAADGSVTVDTTTLKVDATNNRVGIGTASPSDALHVKGFTQVESTAGDAAYIRFNNTVNSGGKTWRAGAGVSSHGTFSIYNQSDNKFGITVNSNGQVTKPNQPVFSVSRTSSQATGGSYTAIQFQSNSSGTINEGGYWSFANHRFTAPVAGKYEFAWGYGTNAPAGQTVYRSYLYVKGSEYQNSQLRNDSTDNKRNKDHSGFRL